MNHAPATTDPIVKRLSVPLAIDEAFALFTDEMAAWWPLATHSVFELDAVSVIVEGRLGGAIVEHGPDGRTSVWGTVTRWDRPLAVAFTWHPGRDAHESTHVRVSFTPAGDASTSVELVHDGWGARPDGAMARSGYDTGWEGVLALYRGAAAGVP